MLLNRRSFIGSVLALSMAPAVVRAQSLMAVRAPLLRISVPYLAGYTAMCWSENGGYPIILPVTHRAYEDTWCPPVYVGTVRPYFNSVTIEARSEFDLKRQLEEVRRMIQRLT